MSRIPDTFIHDLLGRLDIVDVIGKRVELKRAGREWKGRSPFTNEKTPSFYVSPVKQMFFDFSSGKNGTVISFLMEHDRLSFVEAVEELAGGLGLEVPREGGQTSRLILDGPLDALAAAERFFKDQLRLSTAAKAYVQKRGVNGETAKRFGLGYAPESWDALSRLFPKEQGLQRHAIDAGLLIEREANSGNAGPGSSKSEGYDRFRNRIMFPIRDTRGRVIGFGGRTLVNDPAKYLNSPETPLFHKGRNLYGLFEARQSSKSALPCLVVVEGYMDVIMLAQHGVPEAVATLGTATTPEHLNLLFKSTSLVVFCFDGDRAGRAAAWRALEQALPEMHGSRECRFLFLPDGQDPDSYVQHVGEAGFRQQLAAALPAAEFLLAELKSQVNLASLDGRAKLAELARPHLAKLREGPLRDALVGELVQLTRLSAERINQLGSAAEPELAAPTRPERSNPQDPAARLPRRALRLLLEAPALASKAQHISQIASLNTGAALALIAAIEYLQEHPGSNAASLLEAWRDTPRGKALAQLAEEPVQVENAALAQEFFDTLARLRERTLLDAQQHLLSLERELDPSERQQLAQLLAELQTLKRQRGSKTE